MFIKVTNYLENYPVFVKSWWGGEDKLKILNRPMNMYVNTMSKHGLFVSDLYEPESVGFAKSFPEELWESHHIPTFIIFGAVKK